MAHPRDKRTIWRPCARVFARSQVASSGERLPDEAAPLKVDCSLIVRLSGKMIWVSVWPIEAAYSAPIAVRYPAITASAPDHCDFNGACLFLLSQQYHV